MEHLGELGLVSNVEASGDNVTYAVVEFPASYSTTQYELPHVPRVRGVHVFVPRGINPCGRGSDA